MVTRFGMSNIGPMALEDEIYMVKYSLGGNNDIKSQDMLKISLIESMMKYVKSSIIVNKKLLKLFLDNRVIIDLVVERLLRY